MLPGTTAAPPQCPRGSPWDLLPELMPQEKGETVSNKHALLSQDSPIPKTAPFSSLTLSVTNLSMTVADIKHKEPSVSGTGTPENCQ